MFLPCSHGSSARHVVPSWLAEERFTMQVDDIIRKCTAFIGYPTEIGFSAEGTGFFGSISQHEFTFYYFLTAAHIVWPGRARNSKKFPHGPITIRLNSKTGDPILDKQNNDDWIFPADKTLDVCAIPFGWSGTVNESSNYDTICVLPLEIMSLTKDQTEKTGFALGDEVFMPSAFIGRIGEKRNIPIIRTANVAAMPEEPVQFGSPRRGAYLIETRSLGGTSGAPIFLNLRPMRSIKFKEAKEVLYGVKEETQKVATHKAVVLPYRLVGMVLGSHANNYASDFISENDTDIQPLKDADFNAGISVALPATDILDFVQNEDGMKNQREKLIQALKKTSGYRPSSASRPLDHDAIRSHKEDFTALLNAAVRKREPKD